MLVFPRRIKHAVDVTVRSPHDADARVHQEIATLGGTDQAADRGLPNGRAVLLKNR